MSKSDAKTAVIHYDDIKTTARDWNKDRKKRDSVGRGLPKDEEDTEGRVCEVVHDVSHVAPSDFSRLRFGLPKGASEALDEDLARGWL